MRSRLTALLVLGAGVGLAHFTWIAPDRAVVRVRHGHLFPQGEEAINASQVELTAIAPSGARVKLQPAIAAAAGKEVSAGLARQESGPYRFALTQDRGISSRTPRGVKRGGRDQHPDATQSSRTFRSSVAYEAGATPGEALGLELELAGQRKGAEWVVRLLKRGKPVANVPVSVFTAGAPQAAGAGRTDAEGKIRYSAAAAGKALLFAVEFKEPAPPGSHYDTVNYEASLAVY